MKRGHIVLISGAVLLVAGIAISAVWGVSFASSFLRENTIVAKTILDPGRSIDTKTDVNRLDRPLSLAIGIDRSGEQQVFSDIRLKETVTDPNGKVVNSNEFGESFFTSFDPQIAGTYTVTVSNLGIQPVSISGAFGHMPFVRSDGKPDIDAMAGGGGLGMIISGGGLAAAGVLALIVGAIITVIDDRAKRQGSTKTSENGIRYRKD